MQRAFFSVVRGRSVLLTRLTRRKQDLMISARTIQVRPTTLAFACCSRSHVSRRAIVWLLAAVALTTSAGNAAAQSEPDVNDLTNEIVSLATTYHASTDTLTRAFLLNEIT